MDNIILTNQGAQAVISPIGAEMISYSNHEGKERIWEGNPNVWGGHGPVLFPVIGSLYEGKTKINGETFEIPKHGIARHALFTEVSKGKNYVELCYKATKETKKIYPFNFSLYVRHTIGLYGFTTVYRVVNHSEQIMPACLGGHPAFVCPMEKGEKFEDYALFFPEKETGTSLMVNQHGLVNGEEILHSIAIDGKLPLNYSHFDEKDTILLSGLRSRSVRLLNEHTGRGMLFEFPKFPVLAIWTKPQAHANYICLEPWLGLPDTDEGVGNMEDKAYIAKINPKHHIKLWYTMTEIEGSYF